MSAVPSMADRDGKIWMDGQLVDWRDAKIHVLTHTLHYGCGAFEGVRAYNTVQVAHGLSDLGNAGALLVGGGRDLGHDVGHPLHGLHHFRHGGARIVDEARAVGNLLHRGANELLDLLGRLGAAPCQRSHLAGHHGKEIGRASCRERV